MFVILASEQPINIYEDDQTKRVAVYVRVSTDSVQQTSSYELQKNYYTSFVESHKNWRLVRIYADEGISGTSLNHRDEFNQMIDDCSRGEIEISRGKWIQSHFCEHALKPLEIRHFAAVA